MFLTVLERTTQINCQLDKARPLLVGVSGGADSLALMVGLHKLGYSQVIAHLDHSLRPESRADADFVQGAAEALGLPFVRRRADVRQVAELEKKSLEEAAREVRYRFLFEQAEAHDAQAVAVAHHADDQVETVLMHFLRGAALSGLSGMAYRKIMPVWDVSIPLVRPLLDLWREDIEDFVVQMDLEPRQDQSNLDTSYFRNRLRHNLIPELEIYNPQIKPVVRRMADVLGEEDRFLDALVDGAWEACFISQTTDRVVLRYAAIMRLEKTLQRRLLRRAIAQLRPDLRDVGFEAIERGLAFIAAPSESGMMDLVARLNLAVTGEALVVKTWSAALPDGGQPLLAGPDDTAELDVGGVVALQYGWVLRAEILELVPGDALSQATSLPAHEAWLDAGRLTLPLNVRGWIRGERWRPLGLSGHTQKMSDFLTNEKVPEHLRGIWPLVCSENQVAWVVGLRPSEDFKLSGETKQIVRLWLEKQ